MNTLPTAGHSQVITVRSLGQPQDADDLARIIAAIAELGGSVDNVNTLESELGLCRQVGFRASSEAHTASIIDAITALEGVNVLDVLDRTFALHEGGKVEVISRVPVRALDDLTMAYTPGVARVCLAISENPEEAYRYTIKRNTVAVVSDGTAVLGLGDIGPNGAQPVMEGKALIFREFAGISAFPICLDTKDVDEIVSIVKAIAPVFGGINLEDISAPRCFEIEERLQKELDIPVFHDDQHGTAVVVLAGLMNALRVVGKRIEDIKVVFSGAGASGIATARLLMDAGVRHIVSCDRAGILYQGREDNMNPIKQWFAENTNPEGLTGTLHDAMNGADVFIGLSAPGVVTVEDLKVMAPDAIVFAMANPTPEIMPEIAQPYVRVMATGRSDYPNQINNSCCFPGFFRGMLDVRAESVNQEMKLAAARALADCVSEEELAPDFILPNMFDARIVPTVAAAVSEAAIRTGAVRPEREPAAVG